MIAGRIVLGIAITVAGVFAGALYINGGWPALPDFDANAIKQFLADEQPSLVFFWLAIGYFCLALGYFHHGYLIRRNSALLQKAVDNAAAALQMTETETHRQRHYHLARIRAAQPRWEVNGCIAHKGQYEIHVRNLGAAASKLSVWKKDLPIVVMLSNTAFVDRGQEVIVKVMFKEQALDEFNLTLEYCDAASEPRTAEINASAAGATIQQEVF